MNKFICLVFLILFTSSCTSKDEIKHLGPNQSVHASDKYKYSITYCVDSLSCVYFDSNDVRVQNGTTFFVDSETNKNFWLTGNVIVVEN